jgi:homopolymeric O-antigen transport system permease protein
VLFPHNMSLLTEQRALAVHGGRTGPILLVPFVKAWQYRELIRAILWRELTQRFRDSYFSWGWAIAAPLVMLGAYTVVFTSTLKISDSASAGVVQFSLVMFVGLLVFNLAAELVYRAPTLLHEHVHYIKKSIFPSETLVWIALLRALVYAGISFAVFLVFKLVLTGSIPLTTVLLPLLIVPFCLMMLGVAWFLAALGAFTRDVSHLMITIVPVLIFATPVFYTTADLTPTARLIAYLNPTTSYIEMAREILLAGTLPDPIIYFATFAVSLGIFYGGYLFFDRYRSVVVDVI